MISYGWKNFGERTANTSYSTVSVLANSLEGDHNIVVDGYNFLLIACAHSNGIRTPAFEVWGTNFDAESAQNYNKVVNHKICEIAFSATASANIVAGDFGITFGGAWATVSAIADTNPDGATNSTLGMMASINSMDGPEMAQTGTAATTFGAFASAGYMRNAGAANVSPGFVVIPCGMFSSVQINTKTNTGTESIAVLGCLLS